LAARIYTLNFLGFLFFLAQKELTPATLDWRRSWKEA